MFLVWASRRERSGTRLEDDAIVVTSGKEVSRLGRADILDLRTDQPGRRAWRVQAVRRDGQLITLLAVPPEELERLRRWHVAPPDLGQSPDPERPAPKRPGPPQPPGPTPGTGVDPA